MNKINEISSTDVSALRNNIILKNYLKLFDINSSVLKLLYKYMYMYLDK